MAELHGLNKVLRNLNEKIRDIEGAGQKGLTRGAMHIRRLSQQKVPVDTGNLKASAYTISGSGAIGAGSHPSFKGKKADEMASQHTTVIGEAQGRASREIEPYAEVGFSAVYAWAVHENPRAGHTGGVSPSGQSYKSYSEVGEYKFLEKAFREGKAEVLRVVKKEAGRRV